MNTTRMGTRIALFGAALALSAAAAQEQGPPQRPPPRGDRGAGAMWPSERLVDLAINRIVDRMAEVYGLDEDQLWDTRDVLKARFPQWLQQNRAELQSLMMQYFEAVMGDEPPTPEEVADWAARAAPLVEEFTSLVDETTEDMRGYLTDEQQVLLDGQLAAMQVGMNYMQQRLATWRAGGYDWQTEWPRSDVFREQEVQRRQRLEREAEREKRIAMGLPADTGSVPGGAASAGGAAAAAKPLAPTRPGSVGKKDEWETYVANFIERYQLDDAQQNSAHKFLRDQQELRDKHVQKHVDDIKSLEARQKAAGGEEEKERVRAEYERLNRPIERYFQRLKDRLETLPTRKQRAAAAQAEEAKRAKAPVSEETKAAMRSEMEARLAGDKKAEQPPVVQPPQAESETRPVE